MSGLPSVPIPAEFVFELWFEEHRGRLARAFVPLEKRAFVDAEELAEYTGLCVKTIRREIEDRNLPHHKVRGRLIIAVSDAPAWLSTRREG